MNTEELLVHYGSQRKAVKGVHASIIHLLCVLDLACQENEQSIQVKKVQ